LAFLAERSNRLFGLGVENLGIERRDTNMELFGATRA
jgi:hypothetical protein